jgi:hypothetical protein
MLSIGGGQEANNTDRDPWTKGLGIFDMTTLSWTNTYDAAAPAYEQSSLVSQFYANNSRYPIEWGDPELQSIFAMPNGTANVSGGSGGTNGSSSSNSNGDSNTSTITSRVVIGVVVGVIGSIAVLAIISSLIRHRNLRRYKRKEKQSRSPTELASDVNYHEAMADSIHELPI